MTVAERKQILIAKVQEVFSNVPMPEPEDLYDGTPSGSDTDMYIDHLAGKRWEEVEAGHTRKIWGGILNANAYRYYIQAQLIGDYDGHVGVEPESANFVGTTIKGSWVPYIGEADLEATFSIAQLDAISLYVLYYSLLNDEIARAAYDAFWKRYDGLSAAFNVT